MIASGMMTVAEEEQTATRGGRRGTRTRRTRPAPWSTASTGSSSSWTTGHQIPPDSLQPRTGGRHRAEHTAASGPVISAARRATGAAQVGRRACLRGRHVHVRAAPGHPLPPGGDATRSGRADRHAADGGDPRFHRARVRRAHRVAYFMYDLAVMNYVEYDVDDPNFQHPRPAAASLGQYHHIRHYDLFRRRAPVHKPNSRGTFTRRQIDGGGVGLTSLDSVIKVALSPRNDFTSRWHPRH